MIDTLVLHKHKFFPVLSGYTTLFGLWITVCSYLLKVLEMPDRLRVYCKKKEKFKESVSLSGFYDCGYYHGDAYEDYAFEKLRRNFLGKVRFVKKFCDSGRLLDVGCALGFFVKVAEDEGFDAYGIDFSEYAVGEARKMVGDKVVCGDVEKGLPFKTNFFDVVTAWDLLEHLKSPDLFLKRCSRVLKDDGLAFF